MTFKQADRLKGIPMSRTRVMLRKCQELRAAGEKVTALTLGEPDFDTPEYITMACKKALDDGLTKYTDSTGPLELREAICRKLKRENGLVYCPEEISVTSGVEQGTFAAFMSFLNPGDEVLVQDPVYLTYTTIPGIAGATVKTYSLLEENDFQPDMNQLRSLVTDKTKMIAIVSVIAELYETVELKPGVRTMLAKLQAEGARMCICSNTWADQCRTVLTRLGIAGYFSFIVEAQGALHKSRPEVFFECMSRLGGADPARCAVCEDAVYAASTAHGAGFYVVGIADPTSAADEPEMRRVCSQFLPRWDALDWTVV